MFKTEAELRGCIKVLFEIFEEFLTGNHTAILEEPQNINIEIEMCCDMSSLRKGKKKHTTA